MGNRDSHVPLVVKNPPAMQGIQETRVRSLGREAPLEKEMAAYSSILAWEIPWTEEPGGVTVHRVAKESDTTERLSVSTCANSSDPNRREGS